jgi:hypothetical protein
MELHPEGNFFALMKYFCKNVDVSRFFSTFALV